MTGNNYKGKTVIMCISIDTVHFKGHKKFIDLSKKELSGKA